jgi:hypothetical protein
VSFFKKITAQLDVFESLSTNFPVEVKKKKKKNKKLTALCNY